jgi:hypothetical protein
VAELQIFGVLTAMLRTQVAELRGELRDPARRDAGEIVTTVIAIAAFAIATIAIIAIIVQKVTNKANDLKME